MKKIKDCIGRELRIGDTVSVNGTPEKGKIESLVGKRGNPKQPMVWISGAATCHRPEMVTKINL